MKHARCCVHRVIRLTDIWRDDAPGERRAAVVENGNIVEIHIQRDALWALGECGAGRIDRKTPSGAYVVADDGSTLLQRGKTNALEGARVMFEVTREAISEPGRTKPPEIVLRDSARHPSLTKMPCGTRVWRLLVNLRSTRQSPSALTSPSLASHNSAMLP